MRIALNAKMTQKICDLQERSNKEYRVKNAVDRVAKKEREKGFTSNKKRIRNVF